MAVTPDTATHQITTPRPGAPAVPTVQHGSRYSIDADGIPDADSDFLQVTDVYGKVFSDNNAGTIPITQADISAMIAKGKEGDCIRGTPGSLTGDLHYTFRDDANTSLPVANIAAANFLQVWVKFRGGIKYLAATNVIKFTPVFP